MSRLLVSVPPAESSGAKIIARVTELSLHGCYLDTSTPISAKTPVLVKIFGTREYFEADATVVYAHSLFGSRARFPLKRCHPTQGEDRNESCPETRRGASKSDG